MKKHGTVTAIDVGTTKICTITANVEESGHLRVIGIGIAPSAGMHKGLVVNVKEAAQSIQASVRKAELMSSRNVTCSSFSRLRTESAAVLVSCMQMS